MSSATAHKGTNVQDPIVMAFNAEQEKVKEVGKLMQKREPLLVTLTKQKLDFEKAQAALQKTEQELNPVNQRLTVLLGVTPPDAPAGDTAKNGKNGHSAAHPHGVVVKPGEQAPMHMFITQAILDKGPLTKPEITAAIKDAGFKSNAQDLGKVVSQTLDYDLKKGRFKVSGEKLPRGTKYTLGDQNESKGMLTK